MPCRAGVPCLRGASPLIPLPSWDIACGTLGLGVRPTYSRASTPAAVGLGFTSHFPGVPHGQDLFWLVNVSREDMHHFWGEAFQRWCQASRSGTNATTGEDTTHPMTSWTREKPHPTPISLSHKLLSLGEFCYCSVTYLTLHLIQSMKMGWTLVFSKHPMFVYFACYVLLP